MAVFKQFSASDDDDDAGVYFFCLFYFIVYTWTSCSMCILLCINYACMVRGHDGRWKGNQISVRTHFINMQKFICWQLRSQLLLVHEDEQFVPVEELSSYDDVWSDTGCYRWHIHIQLTKSSLIFGKFDLFPLVVPSGIVPVLYQCYFFSLFLLFIFMAHDRNFFISMDCTIEFCIRFSLLLLVNDGYS